MLHEAMMKDTIHWIVNNLEGKLDLNDVALRVGYSKGHLQRLFKVHSGVSLASFIRHQKLKYALMEILNSEQRIVDVALKFGFGSNSTFTRAFCKSYGFSPNIIRKQCYRRFLLESIN